MRTNGVRRIRWHTSRGILSPASRRRCRSEDAVKPVRLYHEDVATTNADECDEATEALEDALPLEARLIVDLELINDASSSSSDSSGTSEGLEKSKAAALAMSSLGVDRRGP